MRSQDRTLLASLGFADPDKGDELHSLACRYLALPESAPVLLRHLEKPEAPHNSETEDFQREATISDAVVYKRPIFEFPISKGEGQYKTTIGFADLIIAYEVTQRIVGRFREKKDIWDKTDNHKYMGRAWEEWKPLNSNGVSRGSLVVEVKIGRVGVDQIIRQLNLYREYLSQDYRLSVGGYATVTGFPIDEGEMLQLRSAGVRHYTLGAGFDRYFAAQKERKQPSNSPEV